MKRKPLKMVSFISTNVNLLILLIFFILAVIVDKNNIRNLEDIVSVGLISNILVSVSSFVVTYIDFSKTQTEEGYLKFGKIFLALNGIIFLASNVLYVIYG